MLHFLRRQRKHWLGSGPWRALPLAQVLLLRRSLSGWHEAENVDGEIAAISHEAMVFPLGESLLGQAPAVFTLVSGEPRYRTASIAPAQITRFCSLGSAGVLGDDGLVYCPRLRAVVAETARTLFKPAGEHPELGLDRPVDRRLAGVSLMLAGPFGHAHYHLLWDNLAKIALFPERLRRSVDHYLLGLPRSPLVSEWLRAAGVPAERVIWLTGGSHLHCEQIIFSSLPCEVNQPRPAVRQALRILFKTPTPPNPRRWLWISRQGKSQRDLRWEEKILAALPRFERLDLDTLPAHAQIEAFAEATVVAGPHGSGMANLAFVQGSGDLVEFFPNDHQGEPVFGHLASIIDWRHAWARIDFERPDTLEAVVGALKARLNSR